MDDEEAWRAAELEMRYADAFVEDEDDDLLKLLPCANDPGLVQPPPPLAVNVAIESAASPTSTSSFSLFAASPLLDECADGGGDPTSRGVLAFPPIHGTSFMLRGDDGSTRWVTAADRADEEAEHAADEDDELAGRREIHDRLTRTRGAGLGLLDGGSITVAELLETLKAEAQEEQIARAQRPPPPPFTRSSAEEQLWVSKYRPRAFRDILSDEAINLQLLQWLKSWDASVFDAPPAQDGDGAAGRSWASSEAHATPRDLRPEERIAILTGPPGVGKTTLVHVLAAHCGYEVMEINASVERTASRIESMIKTAVSAGGSGARARRVVGQRPPDSGAPPTSLMDHLLAPKCLVIDEIDGISANVAQLLIKQDIHRPVFCLCNDLYVPALRPLRQHCYNVVHLPAIRPQRLQSRLQQIAEMEGMELDSAVVAELVRCSSGDVRSCLNTLQFLRLLPNTSSSSATSSATTPRQAALDLVRHMHSKDARSDVWGAWNAVFTKPERSKCIQLLHKVYGVDYEALMEASTQHAIAAVAARKARETARVIGTSNTTSSSSSTNPTHSRLPAHGLEVVSGFRVDAGFLHLSHVLRDCPDAASLLDGLFDNYSLRSYPDFSMAKSASVAAAFAEQDLLTTAAFQRAASLIPFAEQYNTITALHCYVCCSSTTRGEKLQYPREHARLLHLSSESSLVIRRLQDACRAELNAFMSSAEVLSAELCPMLCRCLFDASIKIPSHSIASIASLPTTVRHLLEVSVARHVAYGLTYRKRPRSQAVMIAPAHGGGEGESEESWRLAPEVDCLGGLIRPFSSAPVGFKRPRGSWGSGGASASYSAEGRQQRFGDADATHRPGRRDAATKQPFFTVREDVRQMLVVEIERYIIAQQAATRSRAAAARDVGQPAHANDGAVAPGTASAASMSTEATLATTSHTNAAAVRDAPATTVAAPVKEAAATPAPLTSLAAFFGMKKTNTTTRRVAPCTTPTAATAAAAAAIQSSSTAKPKASQVRYTYQDGATNAVKMPAVLADFM